MYSHNQFRESMGAESSNINMYLGCEESGGGYTNLFDPSRPAGERSVGSTLRFSLTDNSFAAASSAGHQYASADASTSHTTMWDYPLHDASGTQDDILSRWIHIALSIDVPGQSFRTFIDGAAVADDKMAFYCGSESQCLTVLGLGRPGGCVQLTQNRDTTSATGQAAGPHGCPPPPIGGSPAPPYLYQMSLKSDGSPRNRYECHDLTSASYEEGWDTRLWMEAPEGTPTYPAWHPDDWPAIGPQFVSTATPPDVCGFYNDATNHNAACPYPSHLSSTFGSFAGFELDGDIHLVRELRPVAWAAQMACRSHRKGDRVVALTSTPTAISTVAWPVSSSPLRPRRTSRVSSAVVTQHCQGAC
jgi:hypothetical protein